MIMKVKLFGNLRQKAGKNEPVHIAVVQSSQIVPNLESWWAEQRAARLEQVRQRSNVVIITGPSRTADIAMQLVMGMHGPQELHLILLNSSL